MRDETVDSAFIARRVARAVAARAPMLDRRHTGCRLIHGESDGLPGVIADRYADTVVLQLSSAGAERWRDAIVDALVAATGAACVYERSDADVRKLEGMPPRTGVAHGKLPEIVTFVEDGIVYRVDVVGGQKTGFYLDQRDNRAAVRAIAASRDVLNVFSYSGAFALAALAGGAASVVSIDSSDAALALGRENLARNPELPADRARMARGGRVRRAAQDARPGRRIRPDRARSAEIRADARARRARFARVQGREPLGAQAAASRRNARDAFPVQAGSMQRFSARSSPAPRSTRAPTRPSSATSAAAADHPVSLAFPEGDYLKGLLIRKAR